jgi:peroxiredoxin
MVLTASTMLSLGTKAPEINLIDVVTDEIISLAKFKDQKALLVIFLCCHCPFVQHLQEGLAQLGKDYLEQPLGIVAISANDIEKYPADSPDKLKEMCQILDLSFSMCYDQTQEVAKAYTAACTPDFFLFNGNFELVYRGQFDDSRPNNELPVTGEDLRQAIDAVLAGQMVTSAQKPSIGCNIKWRAGNEPPYFG